MKTENTSNFRLLITVANLMASGGWRDVATKSRLGYDIQGRTKLNEIDLHIALLD